MHKTFILATLASAGISPLWAHETSEITSATPHVEAAFDLIQTRVFKEGNALVFEQTVAGTAGSRAPAAKGQFASADVYSYVWPTSLNASAVHFDADAGILALVLTAHPDFDDTPQADENRDGHNDNDGGLWHSHWVVLTKDAQCGPNELKVKDIPTGSHPTLPSTWPGAPIYIDSPGYALTLEKSTAQIRVPLAAVGFPADFHYDGVTAALQVNANLHNPLLCVKEVWDIASGDLSLPARWTAESSKDAR